MAPASPDTSARGDARPAEVAARRWRRVAYLLVPAIAFVAFVGWAAMSQGSVPRPGDEAPEWSAPLLIGDGSVGSTELAGKPVLLNFWASWCGPCEDEAPMLRRAQHEYGERVHLVGVNIRDARSDALAFVERHRLGELTHVRDDALAMYDSFGLTGQPETFLIDSDGMVVEHVPGAIASQEQLFSLLDVLVRRDG